MARNERKRQQALAKKRSKRELRKNADKQLQASSSSAAAMGQWPIHSAWIMASWREKMLAPMFIVRRQPNGAFALGSFLVDLGCLGLKNTFAAMNLTANDLEEKLNPPGSLDAKMVQCDPNLVAKVLLTGVEFAEQLGFMPHKDFKRSIAMLQGLDPEACAEPVTAGQDGKPFYIAGPYDNQARIMRQLEAKVGRDGFTFIAGLGDPFASLDDDDVDEDDDDDDDDDDIYDDEEDDDEIEG